ncbi:hypothetical protein [Sphingomonas koreensis]
MPHLRSRRPVLGLALLSIAAVMPATAARPKTDDLNGSLDAARRVGAGHFLGRGMIPDAGAENATGEVAGWSAAALPGLPIAES